jgi:hypothetical protein
MTESLTPSGFFVLRAPLLPLLIEAVGLLHRVSPGLDNPQLRRFKETFRARYEDREVPLMEALDEEIGIGFDPSAHPAADESPLLADIELGGGGGEAVFTARDAVLLDLLLIPADADHERTGAAVAGTTADLDDGS